MEKKLFIRQTTIPAIKDKWYTLKKAGGISPCIFGKPQAWIGSALANCVGYAWGRFAYLEEDEKCLVGCVKGTDWPDDAKDWYANSKAQGFPVGDEPKLGAVAVWQRKGGLGHVAIVEKVYKDKSWDSSESGLNTRPYWFTRHYNENSYRSGYTFIGFVYSKKYEFVEEIDPQPVPEPKFKIGDEVIISGSLYKSANASKPSGTIKDKKTKITRYVANTLHPYNTTGDLGWMNEDDITLVTPTPTPTPAALKVGDLVQITSSGNSRPDGKGSTAYGINYKRYIIGIKEGAAYPYQVGVKNGTTTGYYKANALKKL